jgi:hypothetical protein
LLQLCPGDHHYVMHVQNGVFSHGTIHPYPKCFATSPLFTWLLTLANKTYSLRSDLIDTEGELHTRIIRLPARRLITSGCSIANAWSLICTDVLIVLATPQTFSSSLSIAFSFSNRQMLHSIGGLAAPSIFGNQKGAHIWWSSTSPSRRIWLLLLTKSRMPYGESCQWPARFVHAWPWLMWTVEVSLILLRLEPELWVPASRPLLRPKFRMGRPVETDTERRSALADLTYAMDLAI